LHDLQDQDASVLEVCVVLFCNVTHKCSFSEV
jgi:hypothetical protein